MHAAFTRWLLSSFLTVSTSGFYCLAGVTIWHMTSQSAVAQSSLELSSASTSYFKQSPLTLDNEDHSESYTGVNRSKNYQLLAEAEQLNQQANTLYQQGKYTEAISLAQRVLAIQESILGSNHPDVANSLNNLAQIYKDNGNYVDAQLLHERALAIREALFWPNHPDIATSLNNLGLVHQAQGNYSEAQIGRASCRERV